MKHTKRRVNKNKAEGGKTKVSVEKKGFLRVGQTRFLQTVPKQGLRVENKASPLRFLMI